MGYKIQALLELRVRLKVDVQQILWGDDSERSAIALGYGSLYNHFCPSNADYFMDFEAETIDIVAVRYIEAGDEITINYNGDPKNAEPTWFMTDGRKRE